MVIFLVGSSSFTLELEEKIAESLNDEKGKHFTRFQNTEVIL